MDNLTQAKPQDTPSPLQTEGRGDGARDDSGSNVLWYSNAPWAPTGYGLQTKWMTHHLPALGHKMAIHACYGIMGAKLQVNGIPVFPKGRDEFGNDAVQAYADLVEADVIVSLYDVWPLKFAQLPGSKTPWVAWCPIDHEEVVKPVLDALQYASGVVSFSKHGQHALQMAGFEDADYIPLGVPTAYYTPGDQQEAREAVGLPQDRFIVGMVGANAYYPSRKSIPQALVAFRNLLKQFPAACLYLHMTPDASRKGVKVDDICNSLGLVPGEDVLIADQLDLLMGFPDQAMIDLYRSFDVLLGPSMAEGFGVPLIESMACGTPVIATRSTSMTEIVQGVGWLVDGEPFWSTQGGWWTMPSIAGITNALIEAYTLRTEHPLIWENQQRVARYRAIEYDIENVVAPAWDRYLRSRPWLEPGRSLPHARTRVSDLAVEQDAFDRCTDPTAQTG